MAYRTRVQKIRQLGSNACRDGVPEGACPFPLAKTKWRDHPIELERTLFYELTGRGATEEANRMLVGQQHPNGQLQIERDSVP